MGIRFFKIVEVFSFSVAALSLILSLGFAIKGSLYFINPNEKPSNITIDDYLKEKLSNSRKNEYLNNISTINDERKNEGLTDYENSINLLLGRIVAALSAFSIQTGQSAIKDVEGLKSYIQEKTTGLERDQYFDFLTKLAENAESLQKKSATISKLNKHDPGYIDWADFFVWFTSNYKKQIEAINPNIKKASAIMTLTTAGSAFMAFIFFTILLLLVKIEANTRHQGIKIHNANNVNNDQDQRLN